MIHFSNSVTHRLLEQLFHLQENSEQTSSESEFPVMKIIMTEQALVAYLFVSGLNLEKLDIQLVSDTIQIKGERIGFKENPTKVHLQERFTGHFHKIIELPEDLDTEQIEAVYQLGILKLTIKKLIPVPIKKIQIKVK